MTAAVLAACKGDTAHDKASAKPAVSAETKIPDAAAHQGKVKAFEERDKDADILVLRKSVADPDVYASAEQAYDSLITDLQSALGDRIDADMKPTLAAEVSSWPADRKKAFDELPVQGPLADANRESRIKLLDDHADMLLRWFSSGRRP